MKDEIRDKSVAQYKYLKFCLRQIRLTMDNHREMCDIKLLADVIKGGKYDWQNGGVLTRDERKELQSEFDRKAGQYCAFEKTVAIYISQLADSVSSIRRSFKAHQTYNPIKQVKKTSLDRAREVLDNGFKRTSTAVVCNGPEAEQLEIEGDTDYSRVNYVNIPVHWVSSVYNKGLGLVHSPKGLRFIARAIPADIPWVNDENMNCYKAVSIGSHDKKCFVEEGWIVTHQASVINDVQPLVHPADRKTVTPHAFNENLQKAVKLMKSRTYKHLTKMLDK